MSFQGKEKNSLLALLLLSLAFPAHAATLRMILPRETAAVGSIVAIPMVVVTDEAINAVSAKVVFPQFLEPISVTTVDSPISLWIQAPAVSAGNRTLTAEGIILEDGFTGTSTLLTVQARVTKAGSGYVSFTEGAVLARDGKGTNILENLETSARFVASILSDGVTALPVAQTNTSVDGGEPIAPIITRYSSRIKTVDDFFVEGKTYPDARIFVALELHDVTEQYETQSDKDGFFKFFYPVKKQASLGESIETFRRRAGAAVFTLEGIEYQFWIWAEKGDFVTPKTEATGVAVEGFSWKDFSVVVDPTTLLIVAASLLGFIITALFGVGIIRALKKKQEPLP